MPLYDFEGKRPTVHPTAFVAPTATLVGEVVVEENASVWYGVVLRGDYSPVVVRAGANIQDGSILHGPPGLPVEIGPGATIAHLCVVHGARVGREALIANGAIVLDGAWIGDRALIAAGSVVTPNTQIPNEALAVGTPATIKGAIGGTAAEAWVRINPGAYRQLAARHRVGLTAI